MSSDLPFEFVPRIQQMIQLLSPNGPQQDRDAYARIQDERDRALEDYLATLNTTPSGGGSVLGVYRHTVSPSPVYLVGNQTGINGEALTYTMPTYTGTVRTVINFQASIHISSDDGTAGTEYQLYADFVIGTASSFLRPFAKIANPRLNFPTTVEEPFSHAFFYTANTTCVDTTQYTPGDTVTYNSQFNSGRDFGASNSIGFHVDEYQLIATLYNDVFTE